MRARQFEEQTVDEVAMNPTTFAQAIEQGQAAGVLVGFEFEVCIPEETFNVPQPGSENKSEKNISGILYSQNVLENLDFNEVSPEQWDSVFQFKNPPPTGFKTMVEAHAAYTNQLIDQVKDLYYKIPEKARKKAEKEEIFNDEREEEDAVFGQHDQMRQTQNGFGKKWKPGDEN
jgi:hypothetical protein